MLPARYFSGVYIPDDLHKQMHERRVPKHSSAVLYDDIIPLPKERLVMANWKARLFLR